ncbi:MAG: cytochrome C [Variovorax paradoxus]|uniref:Cytochrome C n=1 Tax=Variovorax paradoxus TaxID=34073 RepID=A0A2W5QJQ9_VARPD|nr:MAG: cytochrome C [Variovorax paradoxus]
MGMLKTATITLAVAAALGAAVGAVVVQAGLYDVAATKQHFQSVYSLLEHAMHRSVRLRARDIEAPAMDDAGRIARGAACYQQKCVQCHGGPGVAQGEIGRSMQPLPGPLVDARQRWQPRELYWITRHGIKMSGMPAWEHRLSDADLWAVVAFVHALPTFTPERYAAMTGGRWRVTSEDGQPGAAPTACGPAADAPLRVAEAARGQRALTQYACNACHSIPGVTGSQVQVGPPLAGMGRRTRIAGTLDHTPEGMVRWLRETQAVKPDTAMPQMGVTEQDARDIAAYLQTLR